MKQILLISIAFVLFLNNSLYAQGVAINLDGAAANASAMLDVQSTNKGLLIPRVALSQTTSASPVSNPMASLMVYNTASTGDVTPGYYYWSGSVWVRFGSAVHTHATLTRGTGLTGNNYDGSTATTWAVDFGNTTVAGNGPKSQGNFGQFQPHSTYSDFNTDPAFWGWNYVQGNSNAPNTNSSQWYREMIGLGGDYAARGAGGYSLELAFPRYNTTTAGIWMRTVENGTFGAWTRIDANGLGISGTTNYVAKFTSANAVGNSQIFDNGTNVGIGTTSPGAPLTILNEADLSFPNPGSTAKGAINLRMTTSDRETGLTFSSAGSDNAQAGIFVHQDNSAGTHMYFLTTDSYATGPQTRMTLLNNGNVGIGTITPQNFLHVNGASGVRISDPANVYRANLVFGSPGNNWNSGIRVYDNGDAELRIWHMNALGQIVLATGYNGDQATTMPTDGLFIDQNKVGIGYPSPAAATGKLLVNGNVGIGTTTPGSALHVGSTGWSANQLHFSSGWTTGGYHATIGSGYTGISASGIMLGTPHVPWRASYGAKLRFASDQAATYYWDLGMNGEAGGSTDRFDVNRNNSNLFTITNTGSVGIGNVSPAVKLDVNGTAEANAFSQNTNGLRITAPEGASYVTSANSVTGAIKIALPQYLSSTMMRMTVKIYQYITDQSYTIELGGYNYGGGGWYNTFANITTTSGAALNVRFGYEDSKNCIWIGETSSTWAYPQVFVTDFQAGYSNYSTDQWDDGWSVSFATSLGSVETVANTSNSSSNSYINNGTASQSANFNITGYGYAGNYFQTPTLYVSGYRHIASTYENVYSDNNGSGGFHLYRNDGNSWGYFYADDSGIGILKDGSWAVRATGGVNGTNSDVSFFTDGGAQRAYINSAGLYFTMNNPNINASSYFVAPGGAYFNSGTVYTEAQYQCRGGIHNDNAGDLTIAGGTSGTTYFSGPISGMSGYYPSNNMVRLTPNLHLNSTAGYAVIANWDNGTTGTSQAFRIGNGASSDAFYVRADSYTWAGTSSTSLGNVIYASRPSGNYGGGRATIYGYRYGGGSGSDGTSYAVYGTDAGVQGYTYYGNLFSFGVAGHTYGDFNRTGGTMGADYSGTHWGSLGYMDSGSNWYGVYSCSNTNNWGAGGGYMSGNGVVSGIGVGSSGGVMGGWSRGEVLGFTAAGELYASYNLGNEYTSGVSADIVTTPTERIPVYSVTSNDVKVYADGSAQLTNGKCYVMFDESFANVISKDGKPTITVTPNGECNGLYTIEISSRGFTVKELNNGTSSIEFSWIAIGKRIDAEKAGELPEALKDKNFDNNLKGVMFNENDKDHSATPIWWDGTSLRFDKMPETSADKPKEEQRMPQNNSSDDVNRLIEQNKQSQPENTEWRPTPEQPIRIEGNEKK